MSLKRGYKIKFDLHHTYTDRTNIIFDDADINTSDLSMYVYVGGKVMDITDIKGTLYVINPVGKRMNVEVENKVDHFYINLPTEFTKEVGMYTAELSLVKGKKRIILNEFQYKVV